jgi:hypothetical protein
VRFELAAHGLALAEEIRVDDDPTLAGIRSRIVAARNAGNDALVASLQVEHRHARMRAAGQFGSKVLRPKTAVISTGHVARGTTWVESQIRRDPAREFRGLLVGWGMAPISTSVESEPQVAIDVEPHHCREWISRVDPAQVAVRVDHSFEPVGHFVRFAMTEDGLEAVGTVERSPAADLALQGMDSGVFPGLSFFASMADLVATGATWQGLRVFDGPALSITEGGPVLEPSDERCAVELVGGHRPLWRRQNDALERDRVIRRIR